MLAILGTSSVHLNIRQSERSLMVLGDAASMLCYSSAGVGLGVGENPESKDYVGQEWCGREDGTRKLRGIVSRRKFRAMAGVFFAASRRASAAIF